MTVNHMGRCFEEFTVGETFITAARTITQADVDTFRAFSADRNPIHQSDTPMGDHPLKRPVVHGMLTASIGVGLIAELGLTHRTLVALLSQEICYKKAVYVGDTVHGVMEVIDKRETSHPQRGILTYRFEIRNTADETVIEGKNTNMVFRKSTQQ